MKKAMRILSVAITLVFLISLIGSFAVINAEFRHECTGENCNVCRLMEYCGGLIRNFATTTVYTVFSAAVTVCLLKCTCQFTVGIPDGTLVSAKVKLSD